MSTPTEALQTSGEHFEPRYDIDAAEAQLIVGDYLGQTDLPESRFVGVMVGGNEDISNVARTLERSVFEETFEDNNNEFMKNAYKPVEDDSRFLMVLDREKQQVAGVMRIVDKPPYTTIEDAPKYIGHSSEDIRQYHGIVPDELTWDVATLAIPPEYRGRAVQTMAISAMLYRMFTLKGSQEGVKHVVSMIDVKAHRTLTNLGIPFDPMHGHDTPFRYWGSKATLALYGGFESFLPGVTEFYNGYNRSPRQLLDTIRYAVGNRKNEKGRDAAKRLGLGRVAGMIATGKNVDQNISIGL